jgi:hypothetical protein
MLFWQNMSFLLSLSSLLYDLIGFFYGRREKKQLNFGFFIDSPQSRVAVEAEGDAL